MKKIILLTILISLPTSNLFSQQLGDFNPKHISIIRLIVTPEKYHDKEVQVVGYLEFGVIYLHKADSEKGIGRNGFELKIPEHLQNQANELSEKYVLIEGKFDMNDYGSSNLQGGSIKEIKRIIMWTE